MFLDNIPSKAAKAKANLGGKWILEVYDNAQDMNLIASQEVHNIITNEGLDSLLNVYLHGSPQITTWYCIMSETNTSPAATMTYAVPSFTETEAYTEGTRPEYVEAASSSQSITNIASKAVFTMNASKTLYGAALVGGGSAPSTKGDVAGGGTLFCYALFGTAQPVINGNVVNLTYTVGAADDGA